MKEKIIACHNSHPSWGNKKIAASVGCAPNTVKYHLNPTEKNKSFARTRRNRGFLGPILKRKKDYFQCVAGYRFTKSGCYAGRHRLPSVFSIEDFQIKLESSPVCYLTGEPIDLLQPKTYELDHILPISKGGDNSLENCGLTTKAANRCKSDLTIAQLEELCKKILEHRGYTVGKIGG